MDTQTIYPVVMAGGSGTRLWPVSRRDHPKQFRSMLGGERSMFQETLARVAGQVDAIAFAAPCIIGGVAFEGLIRDQLNAIGQAAAHILLEPFGRNTAAVAALAASLPEDPDALVLLLPSDHHIADTQAFRAAVAEAARTAAQGYVTTFGIEARTPETGYGYIRMGEHLEGHMHRFERFEEKPDRETAQAYVADGSYAWNAGIFLFPAGLMRAELDAHVPGLRKAAEAARASGRGDGVICHLDAERFRDCDAIPIDIAVMEKTRRGAVYGPLACGWNDIGSWSAVADLSETGAGASSPGVLCLDTENCHVQSDGETLLAVVGARDLVIVAEAGRVLVVPRDRAQEVKQIVETLKDQGRDDLL